MATITAQRKSNPAALKHIRAKTVIGKAQSTIPQISIATDLPDTESEYMIHTYCRPNGLPVAHQENKKNSYMKKTVVQDSSLLQYKGFSGCKVMNSSFAYPHFYVKAKEMKINLSSSANNSVTTYSQYKMHIIKKHKIMRPATSASNFYGSSIRTSLYSIGSPDGHLKKSPPAGLKIPPELYDELFSSQ